MAERIYKLQPNRTIQLRGFDDLGASAAMHSATASGFKVSGVFRDAADFAVLILHDADNFYEHPRLKFLPDTSFSGLKLTFDVRYSGLMPLDSPKFATIDWPYLDVVRPDGSTAQVPLFDYATQAGGTYSNAEGTFVIEDNGLVAYDRITLWYLNFAFDYIVPVAVPLPTASDIATALAAQINGVNWQAFGTLIPLRAEADGATLRIIADRPGVDGNMIRMYAVAKNERLRTAEPVAVFQGGNSDAVWRVSLDFSALGIDDVRLMWLTFAPPLANGTALTDTEWEAEFSNWTLCGPEEKKALAVAGPGSVRVEEDDAWCSYSGAWTSETGFYSGGFARVASTVGDSVTVFYSCPSEHNLYLGTSIYSDRGAVAVRLDDGEETELDCALDVDTAIVTRRLVRVGVPGGRHSVAVRLKSEGRFYFDFLEAAVPSDVPDALEPVTNVSPALDYSTDHTYKLPPARILWSLDRLGFAGPMNEYIGVFWWNQRKRVDHAIPTATVTFAGEFLDGDQIFLNIGGQTCGKTVFPNEDGALIAKHFAYFINSTYVGVWASATEYVLTITARSPRPAYSYSLEAWKESNQNSGGTVVTSGTLQGGHTWRWVIDPTQYPAFNRGASDWHRDLFRECRARGREITVAASMELVNPPEGFAAMFPDGEEVTTSVGFGSLVSTHGAFSSPMLNYHKQVFAAVAALMAEAGLTPCLQFGEFCWWYFTNRSAERPYGGMAYHDAETEAEAQTALGRSLHVFEGPTDDPAVNGGADATFLRNRLRDYVASLGSYLRGLHPEAKLEVLFPYDANHPVPAGVHQIGGRLNRFVNLPAEWEAKETSGLDRLKVEALDFGVWTRDLGLTAAAIRFALRLDWPADSLRHMVPVFQPGYPWERECSVALGEGMSAVNLWAYDHICLHGAAVPPKSRRRRSSLLG